MEFCSDCGKMLMPKKSDDEMTLECPNCGHTKKLFREKDYRFGKEKKNRKNADVAVVEEEKKTKIEQTEFEIDTDAYAEMYEEGY
ncbi:MAG: hypothetical protein ACLFUR_05000 [Candidatus Hadarchaeia archaeon]